MPICSRAPERCHCQSLSSHRLEALTWRTVELLVSLGAVAIVITVVTPALHRAGRHECCCPCGDEMLEKTNCIEPSQVARTCPALPRGWFLCPCAVE